MTPEADDVDADIRAEQDMDLPSVSEWVEHGLAAAEDLSAAYHEGRDGPGGLNVGTMRAHIDAITAAFEAIRADTTRPSDTASLATTREACLHEDEDFGRGSAIVRVNDDRYECAVCGQRFRLVPGGSLAVPVAGADTPTPRLDALGEALVFLRKRLVGTPPHVDMEDVWFASLLDEAEAVGRGTEAATRPSDAPPAQTDALGLPDDWLNAAAGAAIASALVAANYGGDSGEDVDRLVAELGKRGYVVVPEARPSDAASLAAALAGVESRHRQGDWTEEGWVGNSIDGHECRGCGEDWPCSAQRLRAAAARRDPDPPAPRETADGGRDPIEVIDGLIKHVEGWGPAEDGFLDDLRFVRAAIRVKS